MQTFFLRLSFLLFFAWSWFLTAPQALAGIISFTSSPSNINNGQITGFVWSTTGNSGAKLNLSCLRGVQYFYDNGSPITCGTDLLDLATNGAMSVQIINTNTIVSTIQATLSPKNADGSGYESATQTASVTIQPASTVITDFTATPGDVEGGNTVTYAWTTKYVDGVNMTFSCAEGIKIHNTADNAMVTCVQYILPSKIEAGGQRIFKFENSAAVGSKVVTISLIPAMSDGTYDASRGKTLDVTVRPAPIKVPHITIISPPALLLTSGGTTSITWAGTNVAGVNFVFPCQFGVSVTTLLDASTTLPCGSYAFMANQPDSTTTLSFIFKNTSSARATVLMKIVPFLTNGTYDPASGVERVIDILPVGVSVPVPLSANPVPVSIPNPFAPPLSSGTASVFKYTFTRPLSYGVINDVDVRALQQILVLEGFFSGSATGNFYRQTETAVKAFQTKYGIQALGNVGPATRAKLNAFYGGTSTVPPLGTTLPPASSALSHTFLRALSFGMAGGADVVAFSKILQNEGVYSGPISGNFFTLTRSAVKAFQTKYGIQALGNVGPATRAKLNALYGSH